MQCEVNWTYNSPLLLTFKWRDSQGRTWCENLYDPEPFGPYRTVVRRGKVTRVDLPSFDHNVYLPRQWSSTILPYLVGEEPSGYTIDPMPQITDWSEEWHLHVVSFFSPEWWSEGFQTPQEAHIESSLNLM